jgi:hypothetical protein
LAGLIASIVFGAHVEHMLPPVVFTLAPARVVFERRAMPGGNPCGSGAAGLAGRI